MRSYGTAAVRDNRHSASFTVVARQEGVIAIVDDEEPGRKSVTNDAENVVESLSLVIQGKRLIYRDTDGRWDEILHENGKYRGFKHVGADSLQAALCMVGGHHP